MLKVLLTLVHVAVSIFLILVVLLQTGKRADLAGAFGGGGSQTAFGTRGAATLLSKLTTTFAVLFMVTSLGLALLSGVGSGGGGSVLPDDVADPAVQEEVLDEGDAAPAETPALPVTEPVEAVDEEATDESPAE